VSELSRTFGNFNAKEAVTILCDLKDLLFVTSLIMNALLIYMGYRHYRCKRVEKEIVDISTSTPTSTDVEALEVKDALVLKTTSKPKSDNLPDDELLLMIKNSPKTVSDERILRLVYAGKIPMYSLEKTLQDSVRAVKIRRLAVGMLFAMYMCS
jgi:hypothetical protein